GLQSESGGDVPVDFRVVVGAVTVVLTRVLLDDPPDTFAGVVGDLRLDQRAGVDQLRGVVPVLPICPGAQALIARFGVVLRDESAPGVVVSGVTAYRDRAVPCGFGLRGAGEAASVGVLAACALGSDIARRPATEPVDYRVPLLDNAFLGLAPPFLQ